MNQQKDRQREMERDAHTDYQYAEQHPTRLGQRELRQLMRCWHQCVQRGQMMHGASLDTHTRMATLSSVTRRTAQTRCGLAPRHRWRCQNSIVGEVPSLLSDAVREVPLGARSALEGHTDELRLAKIVAGAARNAQLHVHTQLQYSVYY